MCDFIDSYIIKTVRMTSFRIRNQFGHISTRKKVIHHLIYTLIKCVSTTNRNIICENIVFSWKIYSKHDFWKLFFGHWKTHTFVYMFHNFHKNTFTNNNWKHLFISKLSFRQIYFIIFLKISTDFNFHRWYFWKFLKFDELWSIITFFVDQITKNVYFPHNLWIEKYLCTKNKKILWPPKNERYWKG